MSRSGEYIVNMSGESAFRSFRPAPLPPVPPISLSEEDVALLVAANKKVSLLQELSTRIPDIGLFVTMYIRKEALVSSQIEGTQCTLDDVLNPQIEENANADVSDVINYIKATEYAIDRLKELPLCNRLLRETHALLLQGVRGGEKTPGEFRKTQNWIGGQGSTLKTARYIPPTPLDMEAAMSDLEKYIHAEDTTDPLIKAALIHYQFETIHPFLDGNGRIGRLLVLLYLIQERVISTPALYLSCYLKSNRVEYYDRMTEVRKSGNYEQWIRFFLGAVAETADDAITTIDKLTSLHNDCLYRMRSALPKKGENAEMILTYLEKSPIIETKKTAMALRLSYNTMAKIVDKLCHLGILSVSKQIGKTKLYSFNDYLAILRKDT